MWRRCPASPRHTPYLARTLGGPAAPATAPLWAELHLGEALTATTCEQAAASAALIPAEHSQHARAVERADALAQELSRARLATGDVGGATAALTCASSGAKNGTTGRALRAQIALAGVAACTAQRDWSCALDRSDQAGALGETGAHARVIAAIQHEVDTDGDAARTEREFVPRLRLETSALALWTTYLASAGGAKPPAIAALEQAKVRDDRAAAVIAERERKAQELEAQRAAAAAVREERRQAIAAEQAQRREEAAANALADSPLLCNDGSLSPSCTCGGPHRGGCSHHSGVAGCSR